MLSGTYIPLVSLCSKITTSKSTLNLEANCWHQAFHALKLAGQYKRSGQYRMFNMPYQNKLVKDWGPMVWFRLGQLDLCVKLHQSIAWIVNPLLFELDKIFVNPLFQCLYVFFCYCHQDGITCGAIKEASRSSKAIDECVREGVKGKKRFLSGIARIT